MKSTQNGARKDGGYSSSNTQNLQYSNIQNHNSSPDQAPGVLANYTLPGVISYLTSEFTSLERYKIMTNLEKSEMKYRIQQLTSELNSVRFINEKQALRIQHLEEKLENSTAVNPMEKKEFLEGDDVKDLTLDPKQETKNEEKQGNSIESNKNTDIAAGSTDIPHVDLEFLRNSRQKLNHSIREIVGLLDPPSAVDFLETHSNTVSQSGLEDLLEDNKQFTFDSGNDGRGKARESIFERYTLSKDDLLTGQKISFGNDSSKAEIPQSGHQVLEQAPLVKPRPESTSGAEESDTETVIMDESDLIGILANGAEKKKGSSV